MNKGDLLNTFPNRVVRHGGKHSKVKKHYMESSPFLLLLFFNMEGG